MLPSALERFLSSLWEDSLFHFYLILCIFVPFLFFLAISITTFVINFGFALIFQLIALVICLAWFVPTLFVCTICAFVLAQATHALQYYRQSAYSTVVLGKNKEGKGEQTRKEKVWDKNRPSDLIEIRCQHEKVL